VQEVVGPHGKGGIVGRGLTRILLVTVSLLAISAQVSAHHGNASYDTAKTITVKGTVTGYIWANPHVFLKVDAKDDAGTTQHWLIEAQNPVAQADAGWSKTTFNTGDQVVVDVVPARNGQSIGRFKGHIVINGQVFKP
jgi:hypothetical protein